MHQRNACALLCILAVLVPSATLQAADGLTAEILVDLRHVEAVELDPGGALVAYTLFVQREEDDEPGDPFGQLWVVGEEGTPRRFLSSTEKLSAPAWSPDGRWITFLAKRESVHAETQIFAIPSDGGEASVLTRHEAAVKRYRWSPDGKSIAFVAVEAKTEKRKEAEEAGRDWMVDGDQRQRLLWRLDIETREVSRIDLPELNVWELEWTPDGQTIVVQASPTPRIDDSYMFKQIYAVPASGGDPRRIVETPGKLGEMEVSPDGNKLAFLGGVSQNDPIAQSLFVVPVAGGRPRNLTPDDDASAAHLAWLDDRTLLLVAVEREGHALSRVDVATGRRTRLAWPDLILSDLSVRPGGARIAFAAHSAAHPAEVFIGNLADLDPRLRTHHNPVLEDLRLSRQEVVAWKGVDGWDISGVLTYPLDYREGKRYPLVLQVHGGPEGVSLNGWTTRPGSPVQLLAKEGFMVLQPNYRGSMGRGVAFSKADHDDLGGKEYADVLAGIDALVERGMVDGARVGTGGWSYGGYFSAWAATRHSERFKAAVVAAGITNWMAFAGTTDIPYEMSLVHWDSWWFDEPDLHWKRSPLAHLDKAGTPTLIVHGAKDERVHPEQGIELYTALRIKGVPTSLVVYPREEHGLEERAHELDFIERCIGWFKKHLGPNGTS